MIYSDKYYKNKLLFFPIIKIEGIFFDKGENGRFSFQMMEQSTSISIEKKYISEFYSSSKYIYSFINLYNNYYIYFGLIAGNTKFSFIDNLNNEKTEYNQIFILNNLINETKYIQFKQESFSLIESFYEIQPSFYYTIRNSQIIFLRNDFDYFLNIYSEKIKIKLLTNSNVTIIDNDKRYELNMNNKNIKINLVNNTIKCSGNNSIINIFFPLTNKSEESIQICDRQEKCEFKNIDDL